MCVCCLSFRNRSDLCSVPSNVRTADSFDKGRFPWSQVTCTPVPHKGLLLLLFLTFSVLVANPEKLLYTVANPARGLLNREKRTKEKVWQHTPPPPPTPHTACSEKINKITRRIYRRYAGLGRSRVHSRIPSARRLGLWVWLRKILHSRLR